MSHSQRSSWFVPWLGRQGVLLLGGCEAAEGCPGCGCLVADAPQAGVELEADSGCAVQQGDGGGDHLEFAGLQ